jgi:hypothetical protein
VRQIRYNRSTRGQLAQLSSGLSRCYPIIRGIYLVLLAAGICLHRSESVLALLVLGQFGEALKEAFPKDGG